MHEEKGETVLELETESREKTIEWVNSLNHEASGKTAEEVEYSYDNNETEYDYEDLDKITIPSLRSSVNLNETERLAVTYADERETQEEEESVPVGNTPVLSVLIPADDYYNIGTQEDSGGLFHKFRLKQSIPNYTFLRPLRNLYSLSLTLCIWTAPADYTYDDVVAPTPAASGAGGRVGLAANLHTVLDRLKVAGAWMRGLVSPVSPAPAPPALASREAGVVETNCDYNEVEGGENLTVVVDKNVNYNL